MSIISQIQDPFVRQEAGPQVIHSPQQIEAPAIPDAVDAAAAQTRGQAIAAIAELSDEQKMEAARRWQETVVTYQDPNILRHRRVYKDGKRTDGFGREMPKHKH